MITDVNTLAQVHRCFDVPTRRIAFRGRVERVGQDAFGNLNLLGPTDHRGQEFGQAAGGGI